MTTTQLAKNLRFKRKQQNLTQENISEKLNISRQAYSNYENGKRVPDLDSLVFLADLFCISLDDLVHRNLETEGAREDRHNTTALCAKSGETLSLTSEERELLLRFRSLDPEKQIQIKKLLED